MNPEVKDSRLINGIDFELEYAKKLFEKELEEKDEELYKMDEELFRRDNEINLLKQKLDEYNISY